MCNSLVSYLQKLYNAFISTQHEAFIVNIVRKIENKTLGGFT